MERDLSSSTCDRDDTLPSANVRRSVWHTSKQPAQDRGLISLTTRGSFTTVSDSNPTGRAARSAGYTPTHFQLPFWKANRTFSPS